MSKLITAVRRFGKKIRSLFLRKSSRKVGKLIPVQIPLVTSEQQSQPSNAKIENVSEVSVLPYAAADYVISSLEHRLFLERLFVEIQTEAVINKEPKETKDIIVNTKPKAKLDRFELMALSFQRLNPGFELKQSASSVFDIRQARKVASVSS